MLPFLLAHHSEAADPELIEWIRHQIDALFGLGPATIVIVLGLVIVAIPMAIVGFYFVQRARQDRP